MTFVHKGSRKQYKIVFLHTKGSKREINLDNIVQLYNTDEYIIICANKNDLEIWSFMLIIL